ncbi:glycosyltransferase family 1 protein [Methylophaga sp.]|uniref:glycosyltransferase family 4 protein n=1 Tax=Methylophaga sp. TaxID=2024840 RepID=UPI002717DE60|nr:glycosyltransferase family 1 protein [Methylophaga sp.]MDO8828404.1 glycosyltransferase family 1 protein [Methylophaga sp.]
MKVLIDVDALIPPLSGIGRYTLNLVSALQTSSAVEELKYIRSGKILNELTLEAGPSSARQVARRIPFRPLFRWARHQYITQCFTARSSALADYVYHAPNYMLLPFKGRSVVTIHDLSFLRHPEFHPVDRVEFWKKHIHKVAERADQIITDSEFQRREICELLNVDDNRVSSIYLGVNSNFQAYDESQCFDILLKYGLRYKHFNLAVSTVEPRKNFRRIINAFSSLPENLKAEYPLVIVGSKGWLSDDIHIAIERLVVAGHAKYLGYVAEDDLPKLYAAAAIFIYPSLYEGFGLPVLEAMACGTSVLTSNTTSIPEVTGDSCMMVDPTSSEDIRSGWQQLLSDNTLREEYSLLGKARSKQFTWEKCLDETLAIYQKD